MRLSVLWFLDPDQQDMMCSDGEVRLSGDYRDGEGRVEICFNKEWGTICSNGWDDKDASVVCRQLGFYPIGTRRSYSRRNYMAVFLDKVHCSGLENNLLYCDSSIPAISTCSQYEAGVSCAGMFILVLVSTVEPHYNGHLGAKASSLPFNVACTVIYSTARRDIKMAVHAEGREPVIRLSASHAPPSILRMSEGLAASYRLIT